VSVATRRTAAASPTKASSGKASSHRQISLSASALLAECVPGARVLVVLWAVGRYATRGRPALVVAAAGAGVVLLNHPARAVAAALGLPLRTTQKMAANLRDVLAKAAPITGLTQAQLGAVLVAGGVGDAGGDGDGQPGRSKGRFAAQGELRDRRFDA